MESQGEEKAEGSWRSRARKLGLSVLGSPDERGCSSSEQDEGQRAGKTQPKFL